MPTFQTTEAAARDCGGSNVPAGMVIAVKGIWTVPAGTVATDVIEMVPVPAGATMLDVVVQASGGTTSLSLDVGDAVDPDRFIDGLTNTAAVISSVGSGGAVASVPVGFTYTEDDTIDITLVGAGATEDQVYTMVATYVMS